MGCGVTMCTLPRCDEVHPPSLSAVRCICKRRCGRTGKQRVCPLLGPYSGPSLCRRDWQAWRSHRTRPVPLTPPSSRLTVMRREPFSTTASTWICWYDFVCGRVYRCMHGAVFSAMLLDINAHCGFLRRVACTVGFVLRMNALLRHVNACWLGGWSLLFCVTLQGELLAIKQAADSAFTDGIMGARSLMNNQVAFLTLDSVSSRRDAVGRLPFVHCCCLCDR